MITDIQAKIRPRQYEVAKHAMDLSIRRDISVACGLFRGPGRSHGASSRPSPRTTHARRVAGTRYPHPRLAVSPVPLAWPSW